MALLELLQGIFLLVGFVGMANGFPEPLNRQEEREAIRLAVAGDEDARERLVIHNLRLVAHIAKKYTKTGRDPDDVISIGTIGLIKAVSSFQPEKGVPLSSYASRCIENEILMSIRQEKRQVQTVSMQESIGVDSDGNDLSFADILGSDPDLVMDSVVGKLEKEQFLALIDQFLSHREQKVVLLRFGLLDGEPLTQREVAAFLGISRSYVSRIEKKALEKLLYKMQEKDC